MENVHQHIVFLGDKKSEKICNKYLKKKMSKRKFMEAHIFEIRSIFGLICSFLDPTFTQWSLLTQINKLCHEHTTKSEVTKFVNPSNKAITQNIPNHMLIYFSNLSYLKRRQMNDSRMIYLSSMKNVTSLELTWRLQISDNADALSSSITWDHVISDFGAKIVSQLISLEHLVVAGIEKITNDGLDHIWSLKNLKTLMIGGGCIITNPGFQGITNLTALSRLDVVGFPLITKSCLHGLLLLGNICQLKVELCDNIPDIALQDTKNIDQYLLS
jgi:hypothetical protein